MSTWHPLRCIALTAALAAGCSSRSSQAHQTDSMDLSIVIIDGDTLRAERQSLLELLYRASTPFRLGAYAERKEDEPLVLVDGAAQDGLYRLADLPAFHVAEVFRMRPIDAVSRYGPRARMGAIVVATKRRR